MIKKETDIMIEKKFNFVYITTNLINEKQYIGDHSAYDLNCAYTKRYIGSGTGIKNAVKKYGKENFKRDILEFFLTKQEAYNAQELYIKKFNTLYPNGYNNSQKGGYGVTGLSSKEKSIKLSKIHKGKTISEKHKNAIREFMKTFKHTEETKQKMRKPKKNKEKYSISKIGNKNPMYGLSLMTLWVEKYGIEEALIRKENRIRKILETKRAKNLIK